MATMTPGEATNARTQVAAMRAQLDALDADLQLAEVGTPKGTIAYLLAATQIAHAAVSLSLTVATTASS